MSASTLPRDDDLQVGLMPGRRGSARFENVGKRPRKASRTYLRNGGVVHAVAGIDSRDARLGHPFDDGSREGFVVEHLIGAATTGTDA